MFASKGRFCWWNLAQCFTRKRKIQVDRISEFPLCRPTSLRCCLTQRDWHGQTPQTCWGFDVCVHFFILISWHCFFGVKQSNSVVCTVTYWKPSLPEGVLSIVQTNLRWFTLLMEEIRLTTWDSSTWSVMGINYQPQVISRMFFHPQYFNDVGWATVFDGFCLHIWVDTFPPWIWPEAIRMAQNHPEPLPYQWPWGGWHPEWWQEMALLEFC